VPTIGSDCGYFRSLATEYGCIDLIDASDEGALAERVSTVLADDNRREYLRQAMSRYKSQNGFDAVADRHVSLYRDLVDETGGVTS
jgi:glycosyltransferase involved in cell wall biosynthesis